ncbi:MAG: hypothetical protein WCD51_08290, partial [Anaerolineae bacterium]
LGGGRTKGGKRPTLLTVYMIAHSLVACWTPALRHTYDFCREAYAIPTICLRFPDLRHRVARATLSLPAGSGDVSVDY